MVDNSESIGDGEDLEDYDCDAEDRFVGESGFCDELPPLTISEVKRVRKKLRRFLKVSFSKQVDMNMFLKSMKEHDSAPIKINFNPIKMSPRFFSDKR